MQTLNPRQIHGRGHQIRRHTVIEQSSLFELTILTKGIAHRHSHTALNLSRHRQRIDNSSCFRCCCNIQKHYLPCDRIHTKLHSLGNKCIHRMRETGDGKTFLTLREICLSCFHLAFFKILYGIEHGIAADKCGTGTGRRSAVQCSVGICHHKGNIVKICLQSIRRHSLQCRPASLSDIYQTKENCIMAICFFNLHLCLIRNILAETAA